MCRETEKGNELIVLTQTDYGSQIITSFMQPNSQTLNNVLDQVSHSGIYRQSWLKIQNVKITTYLYENTNFLSIYTQEAQNLHQLKSSLSDPNLISKSEHC